MALRRSSVLRHNQRRCSLKKGNIWNEATNGLLGVNCPVVRRERLFPYAGFSIVRLLFLSDSVPSPGFQVISHSKQHPIAPKHRPPIPCSISSQASYPKQSNTRMLPSSSAPIVLLIPWHRSSPPDAKETHLASIHHREHRLPSLGNRYATPSRGLVPSSELL